jgi:hypothetical protein
VHKDDLTTVVQKDLMAAELQDLPESVASEDFVGLEFLVY